VSLDGRIADETGNFDWAEPDEIVHAHVNERERSVGTFLYGRRLYETMVAWEHPEEFVGDSAAGRDYAQIWQEADKVVYSRTLETPSSERTRIERSFGPDAVRAVKDATDRDLSIGGADIGGQALAAGLVDDLFAYVVPWLIGAGTRWLPEGVRVPLELVDEHRFDSGVVFVHHRVRTAR